MKKILTEFKEFVNRGSVVDMAVGIMIGAAFKAIVDSLVNDLISPLIGLIVQKDFSELSFVVSFPSLSGGDPVSVQIRYGAFIMAVLNFLIIAIVLFSIIKLMNKIQKLGKKPEKAAEPPAPTTKICPFCKSEIAIDATRCPHCTSDLTAAEK